MTISLANKHFVQCARCDTRYPSSPIQYTAERCACASIASTSDLTTVLWGNHNSLQHCFDTFVLTLPTLVADEGVYCDACVNVLLDQKAIALVPKSKPSAKPPFPLKARST